MISLSTKRHATWAEVPSLFRLKDDRLKAGRLDIAGLMGSLLFRLTAQEPLTFMVVAVRVVVRRSPRVTCCPASDACGPCRLRPHQQKCRVPAWRSCASSHSSAASG